MIYILKIPLLFNNNNISFAVAPSSAFMLKMNYLHWVQWYTQSWISPGYKLLLWKWCHESKHRLNFIHSVNLDLEEERKKRSNILVFYHCQHHTSYWNISFIYFFNNDLFIILSWINVAKTHPFICQRTFLNKKIGYWKN